MEKLFFLPISIGTGFAAGLVGKKLFSAIWGLIDDEEHPKAEHRDVNSASWHRAGDPGSALRADPRARRPRRAPWVCAADRRLARPRAPRGEEVDGATLPTGVGERASAGDLGASLTRRRGSASDGPALTPCQGWRALSHRRRRCRLGRPAGVSASCSISCWTRPAASARRDDGLSSPGADPTEQAPPLPGRSATIDEIVAVMRQAGIVTADVMRGRSPSWRRCKDPEALMVPRATGRAATRSADPHGKGDRRREVGWTRDARPGQPDGWLHLRDRRACSHRARGAAPPRCRDWGRVALNQLHHAHAIELLDQGISVAPDAAPTPARVPRTTVGTSSRIPREDHRHGTDPTQPSEVPPTRSAQLARAHDQTNHI